MPALAVTGNLELTALAVTGNSEIQVCVMLKSTQVWSFIFFLNFTLRSILEKDLSKNLTLSKRDVLTMSFESSQTL